ncbi:MAG: hypothetical protein LBB79_04065 [Prevotellaceae bacterium]|nr:hypothetical protein [Prevotellaceae bacterium]
MGGVSAIPLGMGRSVEKHPHHQTPTFRRNVSEIFVDTFLTECVAHGCICHFYRAIHSYGMKKTQATCHTSLPDLTPDPSPKERGGLRRTSCHPTRHSDRSAHVETHGVRPAAHRARRASRPHPTRHSDQSA